MVTRSSTSIYILMRDNAIRNKGYYNDQKSFDDKSSLIGRSDSMELGLSSQVPSDDRVPDVIHSYEEIQYDFDRIRMKMRELIALHDKHVNRPSMDDNAEEELAIEAMTKELTQAFSRCHRKLQHLTNRANQRDGQLNANIQSAVAKTLQEMSDEFRRSQSGYLRMLKAREEKTSFQPDHLGYSVSEDDGLSEYVGREFALKLVEDNTIFVQQHEQEVNMILRSIQELNEIFSDIAHLVVQQGEVIDRIDYNLENVESKVGEGLKHLKKAEKYQKKNRKMIVILVLASLIVLLTIILVFTKFK